ncbi:MAG TPA: class II glutamine amidotransferase [Polyangiaceae bacterium]|nr:class II glutamine amidotransferase [Polyangiaceae bacterium]
MCRLFGFRSVIPSQVHRSLLAAENALGVQSNQHPDGWGVAFYIDGAPHVTRSPSTALGDALFHRLSGVVASETVLAHVRKATQGEKTIFNCHPFQHGRWVFAHNGDIPRFEELRGALLELVEPPLRRFVMGDTDSEIVFFVFVSELARATGAGQRPELGQAMAALRSTVKRVREVCDGRPGVDAALLTLLATDGENLVATHGGKQLYYSTYKTRCSDRAHCASLSPVCEAPSPSGIVNHFIVSSEPLQGENVWLPLEPGDIVGVDRKMQIARSHLDRNPLPLAVAPIELVANG